MLIIAETDPRDPQTAALLAQHHALMQSLFPPEDNFYLDVDALCADHIHFYTARIGDQTLGAGAVALMDDYAEVKSMFTLPAARGKGVAAALLRQIEDTARAAKAPLLKLETGDTLYDAQRLYARHGFTPCVAFGPYTNAASSVFMEKPLT